MPKRWLRPAALTVALLYPLSLVLAMLLFRFVGERWWATAMALYLPRWAFLLPLPFVLAGLFALKLWRPFWTVLVASLALGLALMGFVFPWPAALDRAAPVVRVFSYNVNSCGGGPEHVVEVVDQYSPDVVFLEEIGSPEKIEELMRTRYANVRVSTQFLVATRFPITSTMDPEKVNYEGRLRSPRWLKQVIDTPLGPIAFYTVHPLSPREGFYSLRHGLKGEILSGRLFRGDNKTVIKTNSGVRALQVADFAAAATQEKVPVVIAGDTNLPGMSYVLNENLSGFQDGFAKAGWGFGYTYPTTHHSWMRIDRMFASDELRFVHFEVGHSLVSDHDCIVADLQRAK